MTNHMMFKLNRIYNSIYFIPVKSMQVTTTGDQPICNSIRSQSKNKQKKTFPVISLDSVTEIPYAKLLNFEFRLGRCDSFFEDPSLWANNKKH